MVNSIEKHDLIFLLFGNFSWWFHNKNDFNLKKKKIYTAAGYLFIQPQKVRKIKTIRNNNTFLLPEVKYNQSYVLT